VVHATAVKELLLRKAVLDQFGQLGLTDPDLLRKALLQSVGQITLEGKASGVRSETDQRDGYCLAYVIAPEKELRAQLVAGPAKAVIVAAYQAGAHGRARGEMKQKNWQEALRLFNLLKGRDLATPAFQLDAARCHAELGQVREAVELLTTTLWQTRTTESTDFLEELGNLAYDLRKKTLKVDRGLSDMADLLARHSYEAAIRRIEGNREE
jgi:hypothetical protein